MALLPSQGGNALHGVDSERVGVEVESFQIREYPAITHLIAPSPFAHRLQTVDLIALLVQAYYGITDLIQLTTGKRQTRDLNCHLNVSTDPSVSQSTHTANGVQRGRKYILLMVLQVWEKGDGIDVGSIATALQRHPCVQHATAETLGFLHHPLHLFLDAHFPQTACEQFHRAARHTAVSVQTFVHHHLIAERFMIGWIRCRQHPARRAFCVLSGIHHQHVAGLSDLLDQRRNAALGHTWFVVLDIPSVFNHPRCI